jgi:glutathione S-transferase
MKLYHLNGSCSLASHISLIEAGVPFEHYSVDRTTKKTADGKEFTAFNPKGYVPALILDNGELLTENVAVLPYIGSMDASRKLIPAAGTPGFYKVLEWLGYVSSEVHKNLSPLFRPNTPEEMKTILRELVGQRLAFVEKSLGSKPYLTGEDFTVADAYLYVTLSWRERVNISIAQLPTLTAFYERVRARPAVQQARKEEGLAP